MVDITPPPNSSYREASSTWRFLRSKAGSGDDPNWLGDVTTPDDIAAADRGVASLYSPNSRGPLTAIEFFVIARNGATLLNRGTCSFVAELVEIANPPASSWAASGLALTEEVASGSAPLAGCSLHQKYRVPANGLDVFTIRMSTIANAPGGVTHYEIWYREVCA